MSTDGQSSPLSSVSRQLKTIPVVMLTSSREEQDLLCSYDLGVKALRGQAR
jgi:hypothetical protein